MKHATCSMKYDIYLFMFKVRLTITTFSNKKKKLAEK